MKHNIYEQAKRLFRHAMYILLPLAGGGGVGVLSSCSDFFEQDSDYVVYSDVEHLGNWSDSVYSVMGILGKMQAIADRTILLGEVRGDLVTLTNDASADLRELANFNADDKNIYNQPRDYYAIINNCNYYIAHADTALKSNRNQYIFMKEYAVVKAYRAWTYLQLVLNYGSVPFVTEPILTKEDSELDYPRKDLAQICEYFLQDLSTLPALYDNEYPSYGVVGNNVSRLFFIPLNVLRGDLALWLGSTMGKEGGKAYFQQAAKYYYKYISERNGTNTAYPTDLSCRMWSPGTSAWTAEDDAFTLNAMNFADESYSSSGFSTEIITMIPGDSARVDGNYSELRNLFNSTSENDYKYSITPSNRIVEISESQKNCVFTSASNATDVTYAPNGLANHNAGDLRLSQSWATTYTTDYLLGTRVDLQEISKYMTKNVHIYRRMALYLRFAEALNLAGQPRMAFAILQRGLSDNVLKQDVYKYVNKADSAWIADNEFEFPTAIYGTLEAEDLIFALGGNSWSGVRNMLGIHSRGSGWTPLNEYYRLDYADSLTVDSIMQPDSTFIGVFNETAYQRIKARQQEQVDSLILNEEALELCFEGYRYYDLMRFALRSDNPGRFLTDAVNRRGGKDTNAGIDLTNRQNWYLRWGNGKIGY